MTEDTPPPPLAVQAEPRTPLDPQIRITKLKNGLTVYVMPHKKPVDRASLWLAVNAGSVQEDENQRGLAHFVEHMAFNGTKRFEKQAIVNYIEKVGMQFGADVNAYTSFDETVYMLTVPTDNAKTMATGLDILRDWAGDISFAPDELEKERGVVLEEWRLRQGAFSRINDKTWPIELQGSKYAQRLPIGLPAVLKDAPRERLVKFYSDWYRPENMAVIAVGDFDAEAMEKEIASRFGGLAPAGAPVPRTPIPVPHDQPTAVVTATDPELPWSSVEVIDKMDHRPEATKSDYRRSIVENLYHSMLASRFQELALAPESPFTYAGSYTGALTRTVDTFTRSAQAKEGRTAEALSALVREIERVEQHGFVQGELDRARAAQLASAESSALEWEKTPSGDIADEMTRNFFEGEQMPGRHTELAYTQEFLPAITLAELNKLAASWGSDKGRVIKITGPATAKLPTEAETRQLFAAGSSTKMDPWQDAPIAALMTTPPTPGKVTATKRDEGADATVWTLSNGVRVVVKPTTFQNDAVEINGWKKGGNSLVADIIHGRFADDVVASGGVGDLDPTALKKVLQGKRASVRVSLGETSETMNVSTRPVDLEVALQLLHLRLTAPRKDERSFNAWRVDQAEWAKNRRMLPELSFYEDMNAIATKNHPRRAPTTPEMLAKVDMNKAYDVYRARFADFGQATFVIVGNVDPATLQPLVEKYLGSLPSKGKKETWKNVRMTYASGKVVKDLVGGTEPKSMVSMSFASTDKWSKEAEADAEVLAMVLRIRLREVLREDMGGVYGVRSWVGLSREPDQRRTANIGFGCDPANVEKLEAAALQVIHEVQKNGISAEYLEKVTEQLKRERETNAQENWWWSGQLRQAYWYGDDTKKLLDLAPVLARITSDHVKASAKRFFDEKNVVFGVLRPKPATK